MASQVDVCNYAMVVLGEQPITSLLDNTARARALNAVYATELNAELTSHWWNFSIKRVQLAALTSTPLYQFLYAYQLPADFCGIIDVGNMFPSVDLSDYIGSDDSQWAIEGMTLVCNYAAPLFLRYTSNAVDEGSFDAAFVRAFGCRLARATAEIITQNTAKQQKADAMYKEALLMAIRSNSAQLPPQKPRDDTWMIARINW